MAMTSKDPSIDQDRLKALLGVLGRERLGQLLQLLQERLTALRADMASKGPDWRLQRAALHQSLGSASSLGLTALAASLGRLEAAIDQALEAKADNLNPHAGAVARALADVAALQAQVETALTRQFPGLTADHAGNGSGALNR
ncbi:MAG TPA: hypothetical protein VGI79_12250 [Caulobacteraceae bacterium]|jgi:HPt (histidine-containing phosphotransfer) domain-containing protein